ncbi:MAG TPA: hypothetical protein VGJ00_04955 [Rhabdochlamydiaceae bacterium]|jgi:hypothetical protein
MQSRFLTLIFSFFLSMYLCAGPLFSVPLKRTSAPISIETYQRENAIPLLPLLNSWEEREFSHYPYLYSPDDEQLIHPSDIFLINSKEAFLAIAKRKGEIVGLVSFIPCDAPILSTKYFFDVALFDAMKGIGFDYSQMLYVDIFLTAPECHNDPAVVDALYSVVKSYAQEKKRSRLCFIRAVSDVDHPLSKEPLYYIEPWDQVILGCKGTGIRFESAWPTDLETEVKTISHTLEFFVKDL